VSALLEVLDLDVGYGRVGVLNQVALNVSRGAIVVLLGGNGAGKTTLLKAISGLLRPSTGSIRFGGAQISGASPRDIVRAGLLHVAEGRALFRSQSVAANLDLGLYGAGIGRADERRRYERVYALFPVLRERSSSAAGALSGGQQQMLAIAQALASRPKLLLLDEPSAGLAPAIVREVFQRIKQLSDQGMTIVLVEQLAEQALVIADHVTVIDNGRVVASGSPQDFHDQRDLQEAYFGDSPSASAATVSPTAPSKLPT
jgi:branched-chain amino acid transport system ATP-binding protein